MTSLLNGKVVTILVTDLFVYVKIFFFVNDIIACLYEFVKIQPLRLLWFYLQG